MNENLNENLLNYLMTGTNLAEIKPEEIRVDKNEEKLEEKDLKKKGKGKKLNENNQKKILSLINCYKLFYTANHPVTNHLVSFENRTQNFISSTSHPQNYD